MGNTALEQSYEITSLAQVTRALEAKSRMLILFIQARSQNISLDNMPRFLENSADNLHDPFTGKPFQWDTQNKTMYFTYINNGKRRKDYLSYDD